MLQDNRRSPGRRPVPVAVEAGAACRQEPCALLPATSLGDREEHPVAANDINAAVHFVSEFRPPCQKKAAAARGRQGNTVHFVGLCEQFVDDMAVHVGKPEAASLVLENESRMVDA